MANSLHIKKVPCILALLGGIQFFSTKAYSLPGTGPQDPPPTTTNDAGSRSECDQPDSYNYSPELIVSANTQNLVTTQANPTLFVYIPFELSTNDPGRFVLQNVNTSRVVYRSQPYTNVPGDGRILRIEVEEPLEIGVNYRWYFEIFCNDPTMNNSTANSVSLDAMIQRKEPGGAETYWYDQLETAAQRRNSSPEAWNQLLQSVGLGEISGEELFPE